MKLRNVAEAGAFAHLMGLGRRRSNAAENDGGEAGKPDEETEAAGDEAEADGEAEAPPVEPGDDDEGDEKEMAGDSAAARARARERGRCAAIFADPAAGRNPALAAHLAFETSLSRKAARAALAQGGGGGLGQRLAAAINPNLGPQGKADDAKPKTAAKLDYKGIFGRMNTPMKKDR